MVENFARQMLHLILVFFRISLKSWEEIAKGIVVFVEGTGTGADLVGIGGQGPTASVPVSEFFDSFEVRDDED